MDFAEILPLLSRWTHVLAAIVLVGGTIFLRWAIVPAQTSGALNDETFESIRSRWVKFVMLSVLFLLVSGLYNAAIKAIGYQLDTVYLVLMTAKIVLALIVFYLVSVLSGRSARAQKFRAAGTRYYSVTIVAMLVLVCIAGYMKMSPQAVKIRNDSDSEQQSEVEDNKTARLSAVTKNRRR